jgi:hypothetical protein
MMATLIKEKIEGQPLPPESPLSPSHDVNDIFDNYFDDQDEDDDLVYDVKGLSLENRPPLPPRPNINPLVEDPPPLPSRTSTGTSIAESPTRSKSFWKKTVDGTAEFAGGLVSHPFEATKHFSILRHSPALVYYKGPSTSVCITIFSDAPLPPQLSFWLQRKGFSGNMGMKASVLLGRTSNWIDVTPTTEAFLSDMPEPDERAWQRDIKKFEKKTSRHKNLSYHVARETCIVRIPAAASDGYLRIAMCTGTGRKKVLCSSPVFRIASTSTDVSIFRGASLSTIPLEAGLKAASLFGNTVAMGYVGPAKVIVGSQVERLTGDYKPGFIAKRAEHIAYAKTGLKKRFDKLEQNYDGARDYGPLHMSDGFDSPPEVVGPDSGPEKPFPIKFDGTVARGTGQSEAQFGIPTANLSGVSSDLLLRLNGIYLGWVTIQPKKGLDNISHDWHEAIITFGPSPYAAAAIVTKNVATVHIIHDFGTATFFDTKLKLIVMGYLRPVPKADRLQAADKFLDGAMNDMDVTLASLSREDWGPEMTLERMKSHKSSRPLTEKYVDARSHMMKRVDSIPMHRAGVRTTGAKLMDKVHGRGGLYIRR